MVLIRYKIAGNTRKGRVVENGKPENARQKHKEGSQKKKKTYRSLMNRR